MHKDFPDDLSVFDEADDPHGTLAFRADQGVHLVYFLYQACPIFSERFFVALRFEDAGDKIITLFFLAFTPRNVAVVSVISHHLLAPVGDMGTHNLKVTRSRQPFQGGEALACFFVLGRIPS